MGPFGPFEINMRFRMTLWGRPPNRCAKTRVLFNAITKSNITKRTGILLFFILHDFFWPDRLLLLLLKVFRRIKLDKIRPRHNVSFYIFNRLIVLIRVTVTAKKHGVVFIDQGTEATFDTF